MLEKIGILTKKKYFKWNNCNVTEKQVKFCMILQQIIFKSWGNLFNCLKELYKYKVLLDFIEVSPILHDISGDFS